MFWIIGFFVFVLLVVALFRGFNTNYRIGSGMFKNSEYNLDEKDDFLDKDYYDKDAMKK